MILIARQQWNDESVIEYFHEKAYMCCELELTLRDSKQQIIEGLFSSKLLSRNNLT